MNKKDIVIPVSLVMSMLAFSFPFFKKAIVVEEKVAVTEKVVAEVKEDTEENKDKIVENEKIDIKQTILIEQIADTLNKLNDKIDKIK